MSDTVTYLDIAAATGKTRRAVEIRAVTESWPYTEERVRGGRRRLFPVAQLPQDIKQALLARRLAEVAPPAPAPATRPRLPALQGADHSHAQKLIADARASILQAVEAAAKQLAATRSRAIAAFLDELAAGRLAPVVQLACAIANDRNGFAWEVGFGADGTPRALPAAGQDVGVFARMLSRRTLFRWFEQWDEGGWAALVPGRPQKDMSVPDWAPLLLAEMQRPQKPMLSEAYRKMLARLPRGARAPSYTAVRRWYKEKYSALDRQRGRHTGSALNPFKFAHKRSSDGMWPLLEVHSDGWGTHFTAPHPISGQFVKLEVWHSHDVATRFAYPPSVGLSESTPVILGSLMNVCRVDGAPTVWQTDNTGSVKNDRVEFDPAASIASRLGMTIVHNRPGNSQANGICENFNRYLDERSKELATYLGAKMDQLTSRRVLKLTQKMVKAASREEQLKLKAEAEAVGKGLVFESYAQAVDWLNRVVDEFNDRPHRELPKITDPVTGAPRHMTPREMRRAFVEGGWQPRPMEGADLADAFHPHERKIVRRAVVSLYGQRYHHPELEHHNGEEVLVAYDITDGSRVWVKTLEGRLICEAAFYESRGYRPQSFYERALERRADAQVKRLQTKIDAVEAARPGNLIEYSPGEVLPPLDLPQVAEAVTVEPEPNVVKLPVKRPIFDTDAAKYRWLQSHADEITDEDEGWMLWYRTTAEWEDLFSEIEVAAR